MRRGTFRFICRGAGGVALSFVGLLLRLAAPGATPRADADVFTLRSGGSVEGDLIDQDATSLTIRTVVGTVRLARDAVASVTPAVSPFQEYEQRASALADTAEAHFALAEWCAERGLAAERQRHLLRTVELAPDHAQARAALGHVRVGALWVDGRQRTAKADAAAEDDGTAGDDERLARAIQSDWSRRIRAIVSSLLTSRLDRLVAEGRERILQIKDPAAILPLTQALGRGPTAQRRLLVDALSAFPQDEATMNLAVIALADDDDAVRRAALSELVRRQDDRVAAQFRKALASRSGELVRHAATGLALLGRREAVPDLIEVLTAQGKMRVEIPVRRYFGEMQQVFVGQTGVRIGPQGSVGLRPQIGLIDAYGPVIYQTQGRVRDVTIYRTEVLEALKSLTGENFGFEQDKWRQWYQENMP